MIPYFILASVFFIFALFEVYSKVKANLKILLLLISSILLILFSSMAASRGDADSYLKIFKNPNDYPYIELGFRYLNSIIFNNFSNIFFLFLIIAIFNTYAKLFVFNNLSKYLFTSIFVLFTTTFISQEMGAIRFSIGTSTLLFSIYLINKNKIFYTIIVIIAASFFHISILVGLILIPIRKTELTSNKITILIIIMILLYIMKINIFDYIIKFAYLIIPKYASKAYNYITIEPRAKFELGIIKRLIIIFWLLYFSKINKNKSADIVIKTYFISIILYFIFAPVNVIAQRFSILFACVEPIIISYILISFKRKERIFCLIFIGIIQYYNLFWTLLMYSDAGNTWIPYTLIFGSNYK